MQIDISEEMEKSIEKESLRSKRTKEEIVKTALEDYLKNESPIYISAPDNALVEGLYEENTFISDIKKRGDFGIGSLMVKWSCLTERCFSCFQTERVKRLTTVFRPLFPA